MKYSFLISKEDVMNILHALLKKECITFLFVFSGLGAFAQTGSITGTVIDSANGGPLIGATAVIEGTTKGAFADLDGKFLITNVSPGKYTIQVSLIGYNTVKIPGVVVTANAAVKMDIIKMSEKVA